MVTMRAEIMYWGRGRGRGMSMVLVLGTRKELSTWAWSKHLADA